MNITSIAAVKCRFDTISDNTWYQNINHPTKQLL